MRFYLLSIFLLTSVCAVAQQHHFLYIQTENRQPFYVKANDKVFSSSGSGYVVISKLTADTQRLTIGFNKDAFPEQIFIFHVKRDAGFILKDYGNGWGLLDLQSGDIVMSGGKNIPAGGEEDSFSKTLAQVVSTPDLTEKTVVENKKEDEPAKVIKKETSSKDPDSSAGKEDEIRKEAFNDDRVDTAIVIIEGEVKQQPVKGSSSEISKANIRLLMNQKDDSGRQMVYVDGSDTVRVFIADNKTPVKEPDPVNVSPVPVDTTGFLKSKEIKKVRETVTIPDTTEVNPADSKAKIKMVNSDCRALASADDFLKLRKKMASEKNDDEMLQVARKQFKKSCFATEQIRNLSALFLTDEGKYKFLDNSYPFVHDTESFATLESLLEDPYYKSRFRAMIRR